MTEIFRENRAHMASNLAGGGKLGCCFRPAWKTFLGLQEASGRQASQSICHLPHVHTTINVLVIDLLLPAWKMNHWHWYPCQQETNSKKPHKSFPGLYQGVSSRLCTGVWLQCCLSQKLSHKEHFPPVQSCKDSCILWSKWLSPKQETKQESSQAIHLAIWDINLKSKQA